MARGLNLADNPGNHGPEVATGIFQKLPVHLAPDPRIGWSSRLAAWPLSNSTRGFNGRVNGPSNASRPWQRMHPSPERAQQNSPGQRVTHAPLDQAL
jgi:hypothetical protein